MRRVQLAALIVFASGPLWAMQCAPTRSADLTKAAIYGLTLGMSLSDAENMIAAKTSGLSNEPLNGQLLRVKHVFYDCSARKVIVVREARSQDTSGNRVNTQVSPPPGTCTDTDWVMLADGHVMVTYVQTRPGDASSQVVARVELAEAVQRSHALPSEHVPVHYYEHLAVDRYGEPTYRDAFKPHKTVITKPDIALPDGQGVYFGWSGLRPLLDAGCNQDKCTEHLGGLAWCPADVTATACSRPSGIPDDGTPFFEPPSHYETPFPSHRFVDLGISPGTVAYNNEVARQQANNRQGEQWAHDKWLATRYQLSPVANEPSRRLVETFYQPEGQFTDASSVQTPFVRFILEDIALYRKGFQTKVIAPPAPVATPSF